jgi:hypothetical protein
MNLRERFTALDENLKLDPAERKRAEDLHNRLGELLAKAGVAKATHLQGSFARKTMLPPLHDIDKVIELEDALREEFAGPSGPIAAMELISDTLQPDFPSASFEMRKHALRIVLPDQGFDFDAVPAFNLEGATRWIEIANTRDQNWERSNTYELIDVISDRNKACDGRFVRQVRMAKQVVQTAGISDALPGLHVETFAYEAISTATEHPEALSATLVKAVELLGGTYTEPTGVDQISDRLKAEQVVTAQAVLGPLSVRTTEALALAAAGDETRAAHIWADLFGEQFPRPAAVGETAFLRQLYAGVGVASTARAAPRTRAWRLS